MDSLPLCFGAVRVIIFIGVVTADGIDVINLERGFVEHLADPAVCNDICAI